jgi:hypothetical protein
MENVNINCKLTFTATRFQIRTPVKLRLWQRLVSISADLKKFRLNPEYRGNRFIRNFLILEESHYLASDDQSSYSIFQPEIISI